MTNQPNELIMDFQSGHIKILADFVIIIIIYLLEEKEKKTLLRKCLI